MNRSLPSSSYIEFAENFSHTNSSMLIALPNLPNSSTQRKPFPPNAPTERILPPDGIIHVLPPNSIPTPSNFNSQTNIPAKRTLTVVAKEQGVKLNNLPFGKELEKFIRKTFTRYSIPQALFSFDWVTDKFANDDKNNFIRGRNLGITNFEIEPSGEAYTKAYIESNLENYKSAAAKFGCSPEIYRDSTIANEIGNRVGLLLGLSKKTIYNSELFSELCSIKIAPKARSYAFFQRGLDPNSPDTYLGIKIMATEILSQVIRKYRNIKDTRQELVNLANTQINNSNTVEEGLINIANILNINNPLAFVNLMISTLQKALLDYLIPIIQKQAPITIQQAVKQALNS